MSETNKKDDVNVQILGEKQGKRRLGTYRAGGVAITAGDATAVQNTILCAQLKYSTNLPYMYVKVLTTCSVKEGFSSVTMAAVARSFGCSVSAGEGTGTVSTGLFEGRRLRDDRAPIDVNIGGSSSPRDCWDTRCLGLRVA